MLKMLVEEDAQETQAIGRRSYSCRYCSCLQNMEREMGRSRTAYKLSWKREKGTYHDAKILILFTYEKDIQFTEFIDEAERKSGSNFERVRVEAVKDTFWGELFKL